MQTKKSYSFLLFLLLFVSAATVYLLQQNDYDLPKIINNYYNDLIALPIVLSITLWTARKIKSDSTLQLTFHQCFVMALLYGWFFEIYLPKKNPRYTADVIDGILYVLGAVLFYGWWCWNDKDHAT